MTLNWIALAMATIALPMGIVGVVAMTRDRNREAAVWALIATVWIFAALIGDLHILGVGR